MTVRFTNVLTSWTVNVSGRVPAVMVTVVSSAYDSASRRSSSG